MESVRFNTQSNFVSPIPSRTMNRLVKQLSSFLPLFRRPEPAILRPPPPSTAQIRGIRVFVRNGNLEQALSVMERKMTSSGMERLFKRQIDHHLKNSEKRVLARKNLEMRLRSMDLARKLQTILVKKIRGL